MPIKFKESQTVKDRATGKPTTANYYIKQTPTEELISYINGRSSNAKTKQKCYNELMKRGIKREHIPTATA